MAAPSQTPVSSQALEISARLAIGNRMEKCLEDRRQKHAARKRGGLEQPSVDHSSVREDRRQNHAARKRGGLEQPSVDHSNGQVVPRLRGCTVHTTDVRHVLDVAQDKDLPLPDQPDVQDTPVSVRRGKTPNPAQAQQDETQDTRQPPKERPVPEPTALPQAGPTTADVGYEEPLFDAVQSKDSSLPDQHSVEEPAPASMDKGNTPHSHPRPQHHQHHERPAQHVTQSVRGLSKAASASIAAPVPDPDPVEVPNPSDVPDPPVSFESEREWQQGFETFQSLALAGAPTNAATSDTTPAVSALASVAVNPVQEHIAILVSDGLDLEKEFKHKEAEEKFQHAIDFARQHNETYGLDTALGALGNLKSSLGRFREALEFHAEALKVTRQPARVFCNLAAANFSLGEHATALEQYRRAEIMYKQNAVPAAKSEPPSTSTPGNNSVSQLLADAMQQPESSAAAHPQPIDFSSDKYPPELDLAGLAVAVNGIGQALYASGKYAEAEAKHREALKMYQALGDSAGQGVVQGCLGNIQQARGQVKPALELFMKQAELAQQADDEPGRCTAAGNIGSAYAALGQLPQATEAYKLQLGIACRIQDESAQLRALTGLGQVLQSGGEPERALGYFEDAMAIAERLKDMPSQGQVSGSKAATLQSLQRHKEALVLLADSLAVVTKLQDRAGEGRVKGMLGTSYLAMGETKQAITCLEQALEIANEVGDKAGAGRVHGVLGSAYQAMNQPDEAKAHLLEALAVSKAIGDKVGRGRVLGLLGSLSITSGDHELAKDYLTRALQITKDISDKAGEGRVSGILASVFQTDKQYSLAVPHLLQAYQIGAMLNDVNSEAKALYRLALNVFESRQTVALPPHPAVHQRHGQPQVATPSSTRCRGTSADTSVQPLRKTADGGLSLVTAQQAQPPRAPEAAAATGNDDDELASALAAPARFVPTELASELASSAAFPAAPPAASPGAVVSQAVQLCEQSVAKFAGGMVECELEGRNSQQLRTHLLASLHLLVTVWVENQNFVKALQEADLTLHVEHKETLTQRAPSVEKLLASVAHRRLFVLLYCVLETPKPRLIIWALTRSEDGTQVNVTCADQLIPSKEELQSAVRNAQLPSLPEVSLLAQVLMPEPVAAVLRQRQRNESLVVCGPKYLQEAPFAQMVNERTAQVFSLGPVRVANSLFGVFQQQERLAGLSRALVDENFGASLVSCHFFCELFPEGFEPRALLQPYLPALVDCFKLADVARLLSFAERVAVGVESTDANVLRSWQALATTMAALSPTAPPPARVRSAKLPQTVAYTADTVILDYCNRSESVFSSQAVQEENKKAQDMTGALFQRLARLAKVTARKKRNRAAASRPRAANTQ